MKCWFNKDGDMELEDGTILHNISPASHIFDFNGTKRSGIESIPITFKAEHEIKENK